MQRFGSDTAVAAVMHAGAVKCAASASALSVARTMAAHRIHSVVVTDADRPPRLVTDSELGAALSRGAIAELTADELAREAPLLAASDSLACALEQMSDSGSTHAIVVGPSYRLLGVVSVLDAAEAVLRNAP